jgi:UDP-N-acetylmuramoyl-L-alanyl-D-glutamate--2,6-diaminopimelate ligase
MALGFSFREATAKLENLKPVTGRMEYFGGGLKPKVFVDFAHTPDALEKVIVSLRKQCTLGTSTNSLIWIVFGCGGDRDKGKRAQMGAIATKWADRVVITDDNPRYEESINIINDILTGCEPGLKGNSLKLEVIQDRKQAIESVISKAGKNDLVLIAGKGHENYQENKGVRMEFSDQQIVIEALNKNR